MKNIFITIGHDCSSRSSLEAIKLFNGSHPFDDKICDEESILLTLKDDFKDFLNINYFFFKNDEFFRPVNKYGIVLDHLYGFDLHNNISKIDIYNKTNIEIINNDNTNTIYNKSRVLNSNWLEKHNKIVVPKIERRIKRFRESFKDNNKVFLWRYSNLSKNNCIKINNILNDRYKNFNLIIIIIHWYDSNINIPKFELYDLDYVEKYYFDISKDHKEQWIIITNNLNKKYNLY
jgi:hypothetical protein